MDYHSAAKSLCVYLFQTSFATLRGSLLKLMARATISLPGSKRIDGEMVGSNPKATLCFVSRTNKF